MNLARRMMMPEKKTVDAARHDLQQGKSPSSAAGEFVREEIHHIREGKHGARSTKQAIAIGLSKARRAGVPLPLPKPGTTSEETRKSAERAVRQGKSRRKVSARRSRATLKALKREGKSVVSKRALSKQARSAARKRSASERSAAAKKAARTKGPRGRRQAARKAARTRKRK